MPQRVEGSIEIEAAKETVYGYWENLENLPNFMANVEEVIPTGPDTTRWRVKGPFGRTVEWEARTTEKQPNAALGWNTIGGQVGTSGQVSFREAGPNRTRVSVVMNYADPPGGRVGEVASRAVANPKLQLEQDLRNLKDILEGRATPEEVGRRPSAATLQSATAAFLTSGAGLLLVAVGILAFLLMRRSAPRLASGKRHPLAPAGKRHPLLPTGKRHPRGKRHPLSSEGKRHPRRKPRLPGKDRGKRHP